MLDLFAHIPWAKDVTLLVFLGSYLIGSVPFGYVIGRACGLGDIRKQGSGNIGATNMLRVGNKCLAFVTLFSDAGKGALAVYLAEYGVETGSGAVAAVAVVLGHIFPVWLGFKGGKGVATTLGALLMLHWPLGVFACLCWLAVFVLFHISSLAALVALFLTPVFAYFFATPALAFFTCLLAMVIIVRHYENIRRLLKGEEHAFRK